MFGCNGKQENEHPPIPDTPREHQSSGSPLFLFGSGAGSRGPGESDEDFQEYLLWKEWQQYKKYQEWLKTREEEGLTNGSESSSSDSQ